MGYVSFQTIPAIERQGRPMTPIVPIERVRPSESEFPLVPHPAAAARDEAARAAVRQLDDEITALETARLVALAARRAAAESLLQTTQIAVEKIEGLWKLKDLRALVCLASGNSHIALCSARRDAAIVRPRQIYFWLARRFSTSSLPQVGRTVGNRDHTTVLHGANRVEEIVRDIEPPAEDTPAAWVKLLLACNWPSPAFRLKKR